MYAPSTARPSITAVDFTLIGGVKHLVIEDSWGPGAGMGGQRTISEAFHSARNFHASHLMTFQFEGGPQPAPAAPHWVFNKNLAFNPIFFTDQDVKALQNILKWEGFFPTNVDSTGYYGAVTAKSVLAWQKK